MNRRRFLSTLAIGAGVMGSAGCSDTDSPDRYSQEDIDRLTAQRIEEAKATGQGPFGRQVYRGYRGLAELPWFEIDDCGALKCTDDTVPRAIDVHCHLGISVLFAPNVDLQGKPTRVRHLLDCDAHDPGCELNLDIYINGNFSEQALKELQWSTFAQGLWGSDFAKTQTIPALMDELDAMRVEHAFVLPIKMGLPFGDDLSERWHSAIQSAGVQNRLLCGISVHPRGSRRIEELREQAARGSRLLKLHPTVQSFYPDDPDMMELYAEAEKLGLVVFFHGGRAGIEPESRHRYALPRHYEAVLANFPRLPVIFGHSGSRDGERMLALAERYDNAWLDVHGQGITRLDEIIRRTGGERLLFGSDWPFYHIGSSLAKVLICTQSPDRRDTREAILRGNALQLFPELNSE